MPPQNSGAQGIDTQRDLCQASMMTIRPDATTPDCKAVNVSAGKVCRAASRLVWVTISALKRAARRISASPHPGRPMAEFADSNPAPASESPTACHTRKDGACPNSHHSTKGVNATQRLISRAAFAAVVKVTP